MPKILLAEDDFTMMSLLTTLLKMEGFESVSVAPDEDVPTAARRELPDVLLMDVHLGHQNGLEILGRVRADAALSTLPVIMSSGSNVRTECMERGASDFLMKPYMPDELISILKRTINKN